MSTIAEVERLAMDLPENDRALLVTHLLRSLPAVLEDEDEGVAEALRRAADFELDPSIGLSLEQLDPVILRRSRL
jgi:putative addiction module component (TIGR02574 family)